MNEIKLKSKILNDEYTKYIYDTFDIQDRNMSETVVPFKLTNLNSFDWNIGLIIGSSGSGKTTILEHIGKIIEPVFDENKPLVSNFDWLSPQEATKLLSSIGLSSVPTWLRPYKFLSNGEQYRARMAYTVAKAKNDDIILVDEYTSVVNRDVAMAMSYSLQKYIRKQGKRIILASCHSDIIDWIMPDWICSPEKGGALEKGEYLRRGRPKVELQISRVESDTWDIFKKHHYLTELNNSAYAHYLFEWRGKPIGINVISPLPSGSLRDAYRESRIVVLPDYQGLGIGYEISRITASLYKSVNRRYYTKTVHPALGIKRNRESDKWRATPDNGRIRKKRKKEFNYESHWKHNSRVSFCHEYIGKPIYGFEELLLPIDKMRNNNMNRNQLILF